MVDNNWFLIRKTDYGRNIQQKSNQDFLLYSFVIPKIDAISIVSVLER